MTRLSLLGPIRLEKQDGSAVPTPGPKATAIIVLVASAPTGRVSRAELAETLWSDRDSSSARHALRQCLMRLHGIYEIAPLLHANREVIQLDRDRVEVDVDALERIAVGVAVPDLQTVVRLCRGEFCAGLDVGEEPFENWLRRKRQEVARFQAKLLARGVDRALRDGDGEAAAELARRRVEIDPYDESAQTALVAVCMRFGRFGEAREAHDACVELFRDELGIEPGPRLSAALAVRPPARLTTMQFADPSPYYPATGTVVPSARPRARALPPRAMAALLTTVVLATVLGRVGAPETDAPPMQQMRLWVSAEDAGSWQGDTLEEKGAREEVVLNVSAEEAVRRALRGEAAFARFYPTGC